MRARAVYDVVVVLLFSLRSLAGNDGRRARHIIDHGGVATHEEESRARHDRRLEVSGRRDVTGVCAREPRTCACALVSVRTVMAACWARNHLQSDFILLVY